MKMNRNSYLIITPNLFKIGCDNKLSIFIAALYPPVEIKFNIQIDENIFQRKTICKPGETCQVTLSLPVEYPVGAGELTITVTDGVQFEEKRDIIVYDNRHMLLVQTSASTYRPHDTMKIRVVATNENLMPIEYDELIVKIYINFYLFIFIGKNIYSNCRMLLVNLLVNFHMFLLVMVEEVMFFPWAIPPSRFLFFQLFFYWD